jgi:hypothetical protein
VPKCYGAHNLTLMPSLNYVENAPAPVGSSSPSLVAEFKIACDPVITDLRMGERRWPRCSAGTGANSHKLPASVSFLCRVSQLLEPDSVVAILTIEVLLECSKKSAAIVRRNLIPLEAPVLTQPDDIVPCDVLALPCPFSVALHAVNSGGTRLCICSQHNRGMMDESLVIHGTCD